VALAAVSDRRCGTGPAGAAARGLGDIPTVIQGGGSTEDRRTAVWGPGDVYTGVFSAVD
jgi:hypothetical protein